MCDVHMGWKNICKFEDHGQIIPGEVGGGNLNVSKTQNCLKMYTHIILYHITVLKGKYQLCTV